MISDHLKCIFIHIPKTAGTSIEKKLGHFETLKYNVQDHKTLQEIEILSNRWLHLKKAAYALKHGKFNRIFPNINNSFVPKITKQKFTNYYKFSVVRNSWSRAFSYYRMVLRDSYQYKKFNIPSPNYSFEDFILEKMKYEHFSQMRYLMNLQGNIDLDYIIRFESVQRDFDIVGKELGLKDTKLPKLLMHEPVFYTDFYDVKTKGLIYNIFKDEIDFFGFKYGE